MAPAAHIAQHLPNAENAREPGNPGTYPSPRARYARHYRFACRTDHGSEEANPVPLAPGTAPVALAGKNPGTPNRDTLSTRASPSSTGKQAGRYAPAFI
jgi:hypothetical protein